MNLKPGTRLAIEVEPLENGKVRMIPRLRVGNSGARDLAPPKVCSSMNDGIAAIEIWAQEQLAQAGLAEVRKR